MELSGLPAPTVTWFLNETPIARATNVTMETRDKKSALTIKGAKGKDGGKFKVVAENDVGRDEAELTVTVMGE